MPADAPPLPPPSTLRSALDAAALTLPRREAETLLAHTLHRDRAWLLAHPDHALEPAPLAAFRALVLRRSRHEPIQHLTGRQEFFGLPLAVSAAALIPRPETEHLVEAVLAWARSLPHHPTRPLHLLDLGTGTGAIALALATHLPHARITACDLSPEALALARRNASRLHLEARIHFVLSDLLDRLQPPPGGFDAIVSNPPYIPLSDAPTLAAEVRDFEPALALFAGPDGLDLYRRLIPQALAALRPSGLLALEIGFGQRSALTALLSPWSTVRCLDDYAGIPRVLLAHRP